MFQKINDESIDNDQRGDTGLDATSLVDWLVEYNDSFRGATVGVPRQELATNRTTSTSSRPRSTVDHNDMPLCSDEMGMRRP